MEKKIKNMLRLFLDSIRDYEHEAGHSIAQDERSSEEFVEIFIDSEDAFDYKDLIKETGLPKFVKLGNAALRLIGDTYYRDGGHWRVKYRFIDGELVSWNWGKGMPWLHKQPLTKITEEEWRKDNYPYAPEKV